MIKIAEIKKAFNQVTAKLADNRDYLNDLDSEIGDSDHGESVNKAFGRVNQIVQEYDGENLGALFRKIGMSIISSGGAAMGPLYGTAFMDAGKEIGDKTEIDYEVLKTILEAMENGIARRGKASPGDKTMLDTLHPAVEAYQANSEFNEAISAALTAAKKGMESTKDMEAKIGRASRLQERSRGHLDPGSVSMYNILEGLLGTFQEESNK